MADFSTSKMVKARKEHLCFLCHGVIEAGEVYQRSTGVFYGDFYSSAHHDECLRFYDDVCEGSHDEGLAEGELLEVAHDLADEEEGETHRAYIKRCHGLFLEKQKRRKAAQKS